MKKIKIFAAAILFCGASLLGYNAYSNATMTEQERLIQQNLEALTSGEEGGGLLYEKEWWDCSTGTTIIIQSSGGSFHAGMILQFTPEIAAELHSLNVSYTIIAGGQAGQKSYCKDGWNFCEIDECR